MKKIFAMVVILSVIISNFSLSFAQEKIGSTYQNPKKFHKPNKEFVWEVKKIGKNGKIYLTGSVHFGKEKFYPMADIIEEKYKEADELITEIDLTKIDQKVTIAAVKKFYTYSGEKSLKNSISSDLYNGIKDYLEQNDTKIQLLDQYKPCYIEQLLLQLYIRNTDYNAENGIDMYYTKKAVEDKKVITPLETSDFQFDLIGNMAEDIQAKSLELTLAEKDQFIKGIDDMYSSIQEGNLDKFSKLFNQDLDKYPEKYKNALVYDRNYNWLKQINNFIKNDKNYFMVVGAGHLVGNNGLIKILKKNGYIVKQL